MRRKQADRLTCAASSTWEEVAEASFPLSPCSHLPGGLLKLGVGLPSQLQPPPGSSLPTSLPFPCPTRAPFCPPHSPTQFPAPNSHSQCRPSGSRAQGWIQHSSGQHMDWPSLLTRRHKHGVVVRDFHQPLSQVGLRSRAQF